MVEGETVTWKEGMGGMAEPGPPCHCSYDDRCGQQRDWPSCLGPMLGAWFLSPPLMGGGGGEVKHIAAYRMGESGTEGFGFKLAPGGRGKFSALKLTSQGNRQ